MIILPIYTSFHSIDIVLDFWWRFRITPLKKVGLIIYSQMHVVSQRHTGHHRWNPCDEVLIQHIEI
jgi:hypothetical protein